MELDDLMGGGGKLDGRGAAGEQQEQLDELDDPMGSKMYELDDLMGDGGKLDGRGAA